MFLYVAVSTQWPRERAAEIRWYKREKSVNTHSCSDREYGMFCKEGGTTKFMN